LVIIIRVPAISAPLIRKPQPRTRIGDRVFVSNILR
jgi:hypothetical protein